jgi:hypothetical protein
MILLQPSYFAPILQFAVMAQNEPLVFEVEDNYQKQTYRNRCYINTPNGKHCLTIPVQHGSKGKPKTKDIKIDYKYPWVRQHLKSMQNAYEKSPFFEFYADDIHTLLNKHHTFLLDLNLACHEFVNEALDLERPYQKTTEYLKESSGDYRYLVNAKMKLDVVYQPYYQLFDEHHEFIPNLSILDLLFMEGPSASVLLLKQKLPRYHGNS